LTVEAAVVGIETFIGHPAVSSPQA